MEQRRNDDRRKQRTKPCTVTLFTTHPTWTRLGPRPGLGRESSVDQIFCYTRQSTRCGNLVLLTITSRDVEWQDGYDRQTETKWLRHVTPYTFNPKTAITDKKENDRKPSWLSVSKRVTLRRKIRSASHQTATQQLVNMNAEC